MMAGGSDSRRSMASASVAAHRAEANVADARLARYNDRIGRVRKERAVWPGAAFIVEALLLLVFLTGSLAVLMNLNAEADRIGRESADLMDGLVLASNVAEEFAADPAGSQGLAIEDGGLVATVQVGEEAHESGSLLNATVTVVDEEGGGSIEAGEEIYRLDTARYVPGFEGGLPDAGASAGASAGDPAAGTGAGSSADGVDATADTGAGASASPEAEGGVE